LVLSKPDTLRDLLVFCDMRATHLSSSLAELNSDNIEYFILISREKASSSVSRREVIYRFDRLRGRFL